MWNHVIQVLGQIVLGKYCSINGQVTSSGSVFDFDILDFSVQGMPELSDMTTDEEPTSE
jgi:hypothetical protein